MTTCTGYDACMHGHVHSQPLALSPFVYTLSTSVCIIHHQFPVGSVELERRKKGIQGPFGCEVKLELLSSAHPPPTNQPTKKKIYQLL